MPIPAVDRVTSPWALAEQVPPTQSQSQASQPPAAAAAAVGSADRGAGRPSIGSQTLRKSLLGVSNIRRASGGSAAGATPASTVRPNPTGTDGKLPTPWSTLRPWDGKAAAAAAVAEAAGGQDENQAGPQQQAVEAAPQTAVAAVVAAAADADQPAGGTIEPAGGSGPRRGQRRAEQAAVGAADSDAAGPSQGCISLTSVDPAVVDLARSATRRLRGLRMCPEGREEGQVRGGRAGREHCWRARDSGRCELLLAPHPCPARSPSPPPLAQITHLVMGNERRTLKLMLAVANGAWLVSPQWVTASLEAGKWLPESAFPAQVRFEAAAAVARAAREDPDAPPLLEGREIYIHLPDQARKLMGANATALRRVAGVLGAKVRRGGVVGRGDCCGWGRGRRVCCMHSPANPLAYACTPGATGGAAQVVHAVRGGGRLRPPALHPQAGRVRQGGVAAAGRGALRAAGAAGVCGGVTAGGRLCCGRRVASVDSADRCSSVQVLVYLCWQQCKCPSRLMREGTAAVAVWRHHTLSRRAVHGAPRPACSLGDAARDQAITDRSIHCADQQEAGRRGRDTTMSSALQPFLALSSSSQAVALLVVGSAAWIVFRLVAGVLKLVLRLLAAVVPKRQAPAGPASPRCLGSGGMRVMMPAQGLRSAGVRPPPSPPCRLCLCSPASTLPPGPQQPKGVSLKQLQKDAAKGKPGHHHADKHASSKLFLTGLRVRCCRPVRGG